MNEELKPGDKIECINLNDGDIKPGTYHVGGVYTVYSCSKLTHANGKEEGIVWIKEFPNGGAIFTHCFRKYNEFQYNLRKIIEE